MAEHKIDIDIEFPVKELEYVDENYISDEYEDDEYDIFMNEVNEFLDNNFYNVILLCEQIKRNFYHVPDFLCKLDSDRLMNFLVDYLFYDSISISVHERELSKFVDQYANEIDISYTMINRFLLKYKYSIDYDAWSKMCKKYTS